MLKINKTSFNDFLTDVMKYHELVAPVQTDEARFEIITDMSDIKLDVHTLFPAKKFFFKKNETLLSFNKNKISTPSFSEKEKPRVIMGLKRCDLNSIKRQDMVFIDECNDPYYSTERKKTILIGLQCKEPHDEYCFCSSMDLGDFYDLMFYDRGESYLVEIGSEKAKTFVDKYRKYFWNTDVFIKPEERKIYTQLTLNNKDISELYNKSDWKKGSDLCFGCASCVMICPSCFCFDLTETADAKLEKFDRKRNWSSCQLLNFTKVSGNHVFRENRLDRFKHRIYHQLQYFKEKHGFNLCTGCGRCIRACPFKINFIEIINDMNKKNE